MRLNPDEIRYVGYMGNESPEQAEINKEERALFKQIRLNGDEATMTQQMLITAQKNNLEITSWEQKPDGSVVVMYEKASNIIHAPDWMHELKNQQAS